MKHLLKKNFRLLLSAVILGAALFSTGCGEKKIILSAEMAEAYMLHPPITLTVSLPYNGITDDILFTIDGAGAKPLTYTVAKTPTVEAPYFVLYDHPEDGMTEIIFQLSDDPAAYPSLTMLPENGTQLCFSTKDGDAFAVMENWLSTH